MSPSALPTKSRSMRKNNATDEFAFPNAKITQIVLSRTFLICPFHMNFHKFDWAESVRLADLQVLINQVAFAECVSHCLYIQAIVTLSVVFNSPLYHSVFSEAGA